MSDKHICGICGAVKVYDGPLLLCPNCAMTRFAPLVRVSSESQKKQGESLRTQKDQIISDVKAMQGACLIEDPWRYSGQEHATPDFERKNLDRLLADASKGLFDAVIVCDASRWSRDNLKNEEGLRILQRNNISFYIGQTKYDLFDPTKRLFLAMSSVINQFHAQEQNRKSIINRIHRAKRGIPSAGKRPYGRVFNRLTNEWAIDPDAQKKMEYAVHQFLLEGRPMQDIADELGMNNSNLQLTLKKKCGAEWPIRFRSRELNIDETVVIPIPELLPAETIEAVTKRLQSNKTARRAPKRWKYLLGSVIFCGHGCGQDGQGYTLSGYTKPTGNYPQSYQHPRGRKRVNQCGAFTSIRCELIDEPVLLHLFSLAGNPDAIKKAIKQAIPDRKELNQQRDRQKSLEKELGQINKAIANLVDEVASGHLKGSAVKNKMDELDLRKKTIEASLRVIEKRLENIPTKEMLDLQAKGIQSLIAQRYSQPKALAGMSWEDKRELILTFFDGADEVGRKYGIYLSKTESGWEYELYGRFINTSALLPTKGLEGMEAWEIAKDFNISMDYAEQIKKGLVQYDYD